MNNFYSLLLSIFLLSILSPSNALAGRRCTGSAGCTACTTCSGCKYCNEGGGTCGVCSVGSSEEETYVPDEDAYVAPVNATPTEAPDDSYESTYTGDYTNEEEEKETTSFAWVWWILGAGVFLVVVFGKK